MRKLIAFIVLLSIFVFLGLSVYQVRPFGSSMDSTYVGLSILKDGISRTHASNIVTSVVFGYRGYDTLGEATIFFVAVLGFYWTISRMKGGEKDDNHNG